MGVGVESTVAIGVDVAPVSAAGWVGVPNGIVSPQPTITASNPLHSRAIKYF